jgi:hypothetical protein
MQAGGFNGGIAAMANQSSRGIMNKVAGMAPAHPQAVIAAGSPLLRMALARSGKSTVNHQGVIDGVQSYASGLATTVLAHSMGAGGGSGGIAGLHQALTGGGAGSATVGGRPFGWRGGGGGGGGGPSGQVPVPAGGPPVALTFDSQGAQNTFSSGYVG